MGVFSIRRLRAIALALLTALTVTAPLVNPAFINPASAEDKIVRLTSLEWPPFSGEALAGKGAAVVVVKAAFAAVGYQLDVTFYPWNRAVALAKKGGEVEGYFPEYAGADVERDFVLSVPLGTSPLGFAERVAAPVAWNSLDDLAGRRIGVVDGYVNTDDLDRRIADGRIQADKANSDSINMRKLATGRIDLAVIDQAVMNDLLRTNPDLKPVAESLRFNRKALEDKSLHIAFRKDEQGRALARLFAEGMAKIDAKAILAQALGS